MTEEIKKAKELCDLGVITEEEFKELKAKLIAKL
ncbi:MAG: SHOCT domain-containing protein [Clostridia bacterium]|nr:SHOCT domain-containing protein [Clostridia bacterium]